MRIVATIEARMASSRFPGKVMHEIVGVPMLGHLITRLEASETITEIVVASTTRSEDDAIEEYCRSRGTAVFRGAVEDVMGRVAQAAASRAADVIVETTGDNPLLDPQIVDVLVETYLANTADYVSNVVVPSYPDGMDVQVFSLDTLMRSEKVTKDLLDREHVTRHIRQHPTQFPRINVIAPRPLRRPDLCVTVDVPTDMEVVRGALEALYSPTGVFTCAELIAFLDRNPEIAGLNALVERKGMDS